MQYVLHMHKNKFQLIMYKLVYIIYVYILILYNSLQFVQYAIAL